MCELLVKARNAQHDDPEKDRRGCYKVGHIVVVMDDGHEWGREETLPNFVKVKIPGLSADVVRDLIAEQREDDAGVPLTDANGLPQRYRRRRWRIRVADIPANIRNTLLTTGEVTVTRAQIRNYVSRIRDGLTYDKI
jgi:hypothetical protein